MAHVPVNILPWAIAPACNHLTKVLTMKVEFLKTSQGRLKALSFIGLLSLVGVSIWLQNTSSLTNQILSLQEGLQTCSTRAHNSYTARLIGGNSDYLTKEFTVTTEECFGEVIGLYEKINVAGMDSLETLNALVNDVSWFHQKALATGEQGLFEGNPESVLLSAISSRYEKFEIKKEGVFDSLAEARGSIRETKSFVGKIFYAIAAFIPLLLLMDFFSGSESSAKTEDLKDDMNLLLASGNTSLEAIKPLINRALRRGGLTQLSTLLDQGVEESGLVPPPASGTNLKEERERPVFVSPSKALSSEELDEIWQRKTPVSQEPEQRATLALETSLTNVIDLVSSKIFTQGINLDINTEEVDVFGDKENLEQAFYNLLTNAIENYDFDDPKKYLSINVRQLGRTILVDFFDSGSEFSTEFLRQSKGLATGMVEHTDLAIAQSLIEDEQAKISFENVCNEDGQQVGRKVQIVLNSANSVELSSKKPSKKRLARLEKTTKKELLERMRSV